MTEQGRSRSKWVEPVAIAGILSILTFCIDSSTVSDSPSESDTAQLQSSFLDSHPIILSGEKQNVPVLDGLSDVSVGLVPMRRVDTGSSLRARYQDIPVVTGENVTPQKLEVEGCQSIGIKNGLDVGVAATEAGVTAQLIEKTIGADMSLGRLCATAPTDVFIRGQKQS